MGSPTIRALAPPPRRSTPPRGTPPNVAPDPEVDTLMGYVAPVAPAPPARPIIPEDLLAPGTQVGDYEILELIGAGGMGSVYAAHYAAIERRVAIKVIASHLCRDASVVQQFVIEARAANQIANRHVVDIHTLGTMPDGRPYLVMELLRGQTLSQKLGYGPLDVTETVVILEQIAEAIEAAHSVPIVHRDLKPDNVFLEEGSDGPEVKILDFGIAKLSGDAAKDAHPSGSPLRTTGVLIGTPYYMAPEQAKAQLVGTPADMYALGLIAFEMLAGRPPFEADSAAEILVAHLHTIPPSLKSIRSDVPEPLAELVERLLAKDPSDRPTATEVREALRSLYAHHSYPRVVPPVELPFREQVRLWLERPKNRALLAAQIIIAALMLAAYLFIGGEEPRTAATPASPLPQAATSPAAPAAPSAPAPAPEPVVQPMAPSPEPPADNPAGVDRDAPIRDPFEPSVPPPHP